MSLERDLLQGERALERLSAGTQREVLRAYARTLRELRGTLADYAARYARGGKLSYVELAKYRRLESLNASIRTEMNRLYAQAGKAVTVGSGNAYSEAYWRTAYALEREAQARLGWTVLNPATIAASVQNPISGMKLSERLQANRAQVVTRIRSEITQGLIRGEGYDDMARRIKGLLDGDAAKAIRVAQTEAHRVTQEGRLAAFQQAERRGVKMVKVWVSVLDDRTRDAHQELDGQKAPLDGYFEIDGAKALAPGGFGVPELDISCRCGIRGEIAGYEPQVRRARGDGVIPYKTYPEWKAARGTESPYEGPEPKLALAFEPAATLDGAVLAAQKYYGEVALPGVTLPRLNEINRATYLVRDKVPFQTGRLEWLRPGKRANGMHSSLAGKSLSIGLQKSYVRDAPARVSKANATFKANRAAAIATAERQATDAARDQWLRDLATEKLNKLRTFERWTFATDTAPETGLGATVAHENAHGVYYSQGLGGAWDKALQTHGVTARDYWALGEYATKAGEIEAFAEVFAGVFLGREKDIPEAFLKAFYDIVPQAKR